MSKIDRYIDDYERKLKDAIATKPKDRNTQGYTKKQWDEYKAWLAGCIYGLKVAKNNR